MKSFLIIGMGKFGHELCVDLVKQGCDVMVVDTREDRLEDLLSYVDSARIGDCTNIDVLNSIGVKNFDACFVCIGTNFQSSLEITSLLKDLGAAYVVSKANTDIHSKFLLRNGADDVIYPERDIAERVAMRYSANHVFDYIELTKGYSISEIAPLKEWLGRTIRDIDIRAKHQISVLGVREDEVLNMMPGADWTIQENQHLIVLGKKDDLNKIFKIL